MTLQRPNEPTYDFAKEVIKIADDAKSTLNVKQSDPLDFDQMTSEELAAKIAELETKDRVVNEDRRSQAA